MKRPELEAWENEGGAVASGSQVPRRPTAEEDRLGRVFHEVDLPEIQGLNLQGLPHEDIARLLPSYDGEHPIKAFLLDRETGKVYGIASGWDPDTVTHNGMLFRCGAITPEAAAQAGEGWAHLGNHIEPVGAAFMRKMRITGADIYINGRNPCWGTPDGTGCHSWLPALLAEGSQMTVYNKYGSNCLRSRPDRIFDYTGK